MERPWRAHSLAPGLNRPAFRSILVCVRLEGNNIVDSPTPKVLANPSPGQRRGYRALLISRTLKEFASGHGPCKGFSLDVAVTLFSFLNNTTSITLELTLANFFRVRRLRAACQPRALPWVGICKRLWRW